MLLVADLSAEHNYLIGLIREEERYVVEVMVEKGAMQRAVPMQVLCVDVGPEPQKYSRHFGELTLVSDYFMEGSPALLADGIDIDVGILRFPEKKTKFYFSQHP